MTCTDCKCFSACHSPFSFSFLPHYIIHPCFSPDMSAYRSLKSPEFFMCRSKLSASLFFIILWSFSTNRRMQLTPGKQHWCVNVESTGKCRFFLFFFWQTPFMPNTLFLSPSLFKPGLSPPQAPLFVSSHLPIPCSHCVPSPCNSCFLCCLLLSSPSQSHLFEVHRGGGKSVEPCALAQRFDFLFFGPDNDTRFACHSCARIW